MRDPSTIDDFPSPPEPQGLQGIDSDGGTCLTTSLKTVL